MNTSRKATSKIICSDVSINDTIVLTIKIDELVLVKFVHRAKICVLVIWQGILIHCPG